MHQNPRCFLLALAVLAAFSVTAPAQEIANELKGKLVALRGKSALPYAATDLPEAKYFALYYSAGWCGPCHQFTPKLVEFYKEMKAKFPSFEIIFMSRDESTGDMEKYMEEMRMPWPAMRFSSVKESRALNKYAGPGIPDLVLLNEKGAVLSDSFVSGQYRGPYAVMDDLKKLLVNGSAAVSAAEQSAAMTAAGKPASSSIKSPSGTNWDEVFKKKP